MKRILLALGLSAMMIAWVGAETIDELVNLALENNLSLLQSQFTVQSAALSFQKAKGRLWPQLGLSSRLSFAGGGRNIDFPVGEMLNPILHSVNRLYRQQGDAEPFTRMFDNMSIPFMRSMEQETRLRLTVPLVQTSLWHGIKIEAIMNQAEGHRHRAEMRDLVYRVKAAAIQLQQAEALSRSVQAALEMLTEHLHLAESLVRHGAATEDVSARARAELASMRQKEIEAARGVEMTRYQVNLLVHRELSTQVSIDEANEEDELRLTVDEAELRQRVLSQREELMALAVAQKVSTQEVALHRDRLLPGIVLAADYGFQGDRYKFDGEHDYWMASLVLEWPLFDGGERRLSRRQAQLRRQATDCRCQELGEQLLMQLADSLLEVRSSRAEIEAAKLAEESARLALEITKKRFAAGSALQLEWLSAQANWVGMNEKWILARYASSLAYARLERVAALYKLPGERR